MRAHVGVPLRTLPPRWQEWRKHASEVLSTSVKQTAALTGGGGSSKDKESKKDKKK